MVSCGVQILILQEELDAYDAHQRLMEDALDQKTATLIHLQKLTMQHSTAIANAAAASVGAGAGGAGGGGSGNGSGSGSGSGDGGAAAALLLHAQIKEVLASATGGLPPAPAPPSGVLKTGSKGSAPTPPAGITTPTGAGAGNNNKTSGKGVTFKLPPDAKDGGSGGADDSGGEDDPAGAKELVRKKSSSDSVPSAGGGGGGGSGAPSAEWKASYDRMVASLERKEKELGVMTQELSEIRVRAISSHPIPSHHTTS